uniref:TIGR01777 family protein n=1 Tax=Eiseniibacteriota bacterium TaxID=2212470 RepID=A0A832MKM6_UNCEI
MTLQRYARSTRLPVPAEEAFAWLARPGAFERLNPPFEPATVLSRTGGIEDGARVVLRAGPLGAVWEVEHRGFVPGRRFTDVMRRGPFARWEHVHRVDPDGDAACVHADEIAWALPCGALVHPFAAPLVRRRLDRMFAYRHRVFAEDLAMHARARAAGVGPLRVLVTGATGLVGGALVPALTTGGHTVLRLTRAPRAPGDVGWDPAAGTLDRAALEGVDAVVHLAGENVAGARWSDAHRARVRDSRVRGTRLLAGALAGLARPPRVLVSASASGIYGDRGEETLDESAPPGSGFLAEVGRAWEEATAPAAAAGIRVVHLRIGVVLTPAGGALARLLLPFRLGLGGPLGHGRQWWPWIAMDDLVGAIHHALVREELCGPVHAVAPGAVRNAEFARVLGRVLRRPALAPAPAFALRAALGPMADEMLLAGQRMVPARLLATGYPFRTPDLEDALRHVLGAPGARA